MSLNPLGEKSDTTQMKSQKGTKIILTSLVFVLFSANSVLGVSVGNYILNGGIEVPVDPPPYIWAGGDKLV